MLSGFDPGVYAESIPEKTGILTQTKLIFCNNDRTSSMGRYNLG